MPQFRTGFLGDKQRCEVGGQACPSVLNAGRSRDQEGYGILTEKMSEKSIGLYVVPQGMDIVVGVSPVSLVMAVLLGDSEDWEVVELFILFFFFKDLFIYYM